MNNLVLSFEQKTIQGNKICVLKIRGLIQGTKFTFQTKMTITLYFTAIVLIGVLQQNSFFAFMSYKVRMHRFQSITNSKYQLGMAAGEFDWKTNKKGAEEKMSKCVESVQGQFNTIRAGGANPSLLDRVSVDFYGSATPLNQVARVSANGAMQLVIEPFEKPLVKEIEKAIAQSGLNLTPSSDGSVVRINLPPITEERRKDLAKQAKGIVEEGKVALRNVRRDVVEKVKAAEKDKLISKDDSKDFQDDLQKVVDNYVKKMDELFKSKEKDLLKV